MDLDPTFTMVENAYLSQEKAVSAWRALLDRDDLSDGQKVFSQWRIGSLYAYNFEPQRGEKSYTDRAAEAFLKVQDQMPSLVSIETLNGATVYGSLPGTPEQRAQRLGEAFKWIATKGRDKQTIRHSARLINRSGYAIGDNLFPGTIHHSSTTEQKQKLVIQLTEDSLDTIVHRVTDEIRFGENPVVLARLIETVKPFATPGQVLKWQAMLKESIDRSILNRYQDQAMSQIGDPEFSGRDVDLIQADRSNTSNSTSKSSTITDVSSIDHTFKIALGALTVVMILFAVSVSRYRRQRA